MDLFFSLHNTETAEYLDGPPGGASDPVVRTLSERFFAVLGKTTDFAPTRPLTYSAATTTAGMPGRMSVTQGLWRDFRIPGFLMEQRISDNPKLGRIPRIADRMEF